MTSICGLIQDLKLIITRKKSQDQEVNSNLSPEKLESLGKEDYNSELIEQQFEEDNPKNISEPEETVVKLKHTTSSKQEQIIACKGDSLLEDQAIARVFINKGLEPNCKNQNIALQELAVDKFQNSSGQEQHIAGNLLQEDQVIGNESGEAEKIACKFKQPSSDIKLVVCDCSASSDIKNVIGDNIKHKCDKMLPRQQLLRRNSKRFVIGEEDGTLQADEGKEPGNEPGKLQVPVGLT